MKNVVITFSGLVSNQMCFTANLPTAVSGQNVRNTCFGLDMKVSGCQVPRRPARSLLPRLNLVLAHGLLSFLPFSAIRSYLHQVESTPIGSVPRLSLSRRLRIDDAHRRWSANTEPSSPQGSSSITWRCCLFRQPSGPIHIRPYFPIHTRYGSSRGNCAIVDGDVQYG